MSASSEKSKPKKKKKNLFKLGITSTGRPPKYKTPEKLIKKIEQYFNQLNKDESMTITGLCLYCGFESRQSFYDYEKKKEFSYTIKRSKMIIASHYENNLNGRYAAGAIFALKNFGWTDKQEIEHKFEDGVVIIGCSARNKN